MKRRQFRCVAIAALTAVLLSSCRPPVNQADSSLSYTANQNIIIKESARIAAPVDMNGMPLVAQKGYLAMYADLKTGHFAVEDLRDGQSWFSIPANASKDTVAQGITRTVLKSEVVLSIVDTQTNTISTATSYASCEAENAISVTKADNGINVVYNFKSEGITVPVAYRLLDDSLRVQINTGSITESGTTQLLSMKVLPVFGAQDRTQNGYFLLANGSGSIMKFNNNKSSANPFKEKVYGDDLLYQSDTKTYFKENYSLPVYGMQVGSHGLFAVADLGAANANVNASSSGQESDFNSACFSFDVRGYDTVSIGDTSTWNYKDVITFEKGVIETGKIGIRYFMLGESQQGVPAMASLFRDYIKADGGFQDNTVGQTAPVCLSVLGTLKRTASVLGIKYDKTEAATTFQQAGQMVDQLKGDGVSGIQVIYENWSGSLLDGKITTDMSVISKLGGGKELAGLEQKLADGGGSLGLTSEFINYSAFGKGITKSDAVKDISKKPVTISVFKRNTQFPDITKPTGYLLNTASAVSSFQRFLAAVRLQSVPVSVVLGSIGNSLYSDYDEINGMKRQQSEQLINQTVSAAGGENTLIGDNPNYTVLKSVKSVVNLPLADTSYDCLDESVPFYQMVLHGSLPYSCRALNQYGDPREEFLRCIETGSIPHYAVLADDSAFLSELVDKSYYGAEFSSIEGTIAEEYRRYSELYELTSGSPITGYERLADSVVKTTYANGVYTLVNTGDTATIVGGQSVGAMDFIIGKG